MRVVIDMQGAQASNRNRGIGRYVLALVAEMLREKGEHEVILALSDAFPETLSKLRREFDGLLPQSHIRVWSAPVDTAYVTRGDCARRQAAELTYEAFLLSQAPDVIYVSSLFEGLVDDAVTSIHQLQQTCPVAVTLFDLIPYIYPELYLDDPVVRSWYNEKIEQLKKADIWLAISESSRQEGINYLGLNEENVFNISADVGEIFQPQDISEEKEASLRRKYGLQKPFVLYTGGIDNRKNIERLISSFGLLSPELRGRYQLAIVCAVREPEKLALERLVIEHGLNPGEVVLTGYIPDEDLVALYNLTELFVFPSFHEGFGLPALEAMRCGAPVIGANTSSLPEVIGAEEALFDPYSEESISQLIHRGLVDPDFRESLVRSQSLHAKNFSWGTSARRAYAAVGQGVEKKVTPPIEERRRPRLAYVSPIPPARSGIADYSADLLPELSRYYAIDVVVHQDERPSDPWITSNVTIKSVQSFLKHADSYDRVIYHFGNSHFHMHMFQLLNRVPGIVVLHDFFLSGVLAHSELQYGETDAWVSALYHSHGYQAIKDRFHAEDVADVIWRYPANLDVLQRARGVIVHSEHSRELARDWYDARAADAWKVIPLLRMPTKGVTKPEARHILGVEPDALLVCSFGVVNPLKYNCRLLRAWSRSTLAKNPKAYLVFVGQNDTGAYGATLANDIAAAGSGSRIKISGWVDGDTFKLYLAAADIGVQLRNQSRGETSAAVLDCMNHGLATIVNAHGSMAELDEAQVWKLPDEFTDEELIDALNTLAEDEDRRVRMGSCAQKFIRIHHEPSACALKYRDTIEEVYSDMGVDERGVINAIAELPLKQREVVDFSVILASNFPAEPRQRQLLVDISELVQRDARSGIQRVVRAILWQWLHRPPKGYQVQPVYATADAMGYVYARQFTNALIGVPDSRLDDEPVDVWQGDVFIGLDLQPIIIPVQKPLLQRWRDRGVSIWFVVYDLLPILQPDYFTSEAPAIHEQWLHTIAGFDGVACISESVAKEFREWLSSQDDLDRTKCLDIEWFHLGADVRSSIPSTGRAENSTQLLNELSGEPSFLMVGTVEPRKGHAQVLAAFEKLWAAGSQIKLVIIGKQGWMVEELVARMRSHPQAGKNFHWLEEVSDEYLEEIYAASSCLIAASYGEGFGLPLIEAAQHGIPIIARDIPVFREVAGNHAFYFDAGNEVELAATISQWLLGFSSNGQPKSDSIPQLEWSESADRLLSIILKEPCGL